MTVRGYHKAFKVKKRKIVDHLTGLQKNHKPLISHGAVGKSLDAKFKTTADSFAGFNPSARSKRGANGRNARIRGK